MELGELLALRTGKVESWRYHHWTEDLGDLPVTSGRLEACDPFMTLGQGAEFSIPPGTYPAKVTLVDVSDEQDGSHVRESYLSLVLATGEPSRVEYLVPIGREPLDGNKEYYGIPVGAGTVAFAEAGAATRAMPVSLDWLGETFDTGRADSWFELMDSPDHYRAGAANILMPRATLGERVVLCHSGWGDGVYPVVGAFDKDGRLLSVHIDLLVEEREGESASDAAPGATTPDAPTAPQQSWWRRLRPKTAD